MLEFRILGPTEAWNDGGQLPLGGPKQRAVLAVLLLDAGRVVSSDRLIDLLWGEHPPPTAATSLHNFISRLRKLLGADVVVTKAPGYRLEIEPQQLDLERFRQLVEDAKQCPPQKGAMKLREALALWRGPPLADLAFEFFVGREASRLEELRLAALEDRIDADLECGRHAELVGELESLVQDHPLRERLHGLLMLALYRSGRQAEALAVYQEARRRLVDELGIEPGSPLQRLHGAILRHDSRLEGAPQRPRHGDELPPVHRYAPTRRAPRRAAAVVVTGIALALGFGAAIAVIRLIESDGAQRTFAAAPRTDSAKTRASTASAKPQSPKPRVVIVREHVTLVQPPPRVAPRTPTTITTASGPPPPPPEPKKQRQGRRVRPVSMPPPPPAAPAAPQPALDPIRIADNFDDGAFNRTIWSKSTSNGVTVEEVNGRLEMAIAPTAVAEGDFSLISGSYWTTCRFTGDFDARVEFELLDWPQANGVLMHLMAWFNPPPAGIWRQSQRWGEDYSSYIRNRGQGYPTTTTRGALRVQREAGWVTTYFRLSGRWSPLHTARVTGAPTIALQASSRDDWYADQPVRIAFDNFSLTAAARAC
jgi:DNA-binding SARP family transcriptional activator